MKNCPSCGGENRDAAKFCLGCGSRFPLSLPPHLEAVTAAPVAAGIPGRAPEPVAPPEPPPLPAAATVAQPAPAIEPQPATVADAGFWPAAETAPVNRCSLCLAENDPDCRFCESCGAPLAGLAAVQPVVLAGGSLARPIEAAADARPDPATPVDQADGSLAGPPAEPAAPPAPAQEPASGEIRCPACDTVLRFCPCCGEPLIMTGQ